MRRLLVAPLLLAAGCATGYRASRDIDRFVDRTLREVPDLPSVGVAAVKDGRVVYLRNAGSGYYIGSTTKAYTGLACAILAQRGVIDLDAPVSRYLPGSTLSIPLRAFLTHTSAIENNAVVFRTAYSGEYTRDQLLSMLNDSKSIKPGFRYDNLGYVVASLVIEQVTGKPWQQALDELVFRPIGMTRTTAYMSVATQWPMVQPFHYDRSGDVVPLAFEKTDATMHAAGGIVTTPTDLAKWLQASLTNAGSSEALKMQVPASATRGDFKANGYAFGWYHGDFHGAHALFHGGGYEGWHSQFALLPETNIGAGVMTNVNGPADDAADLIVAYILDRLSGKADVDAGYAKRLDQMKERLAKGKQQFVDAIRQRDKRPWMLQHPLASYAGRYNNAAYGTLVVEERDGKLYASIGPLRSVLEPYTKPETARVEIVPGSGDVLEFRFSTAPNPDAVLWGDDVFARVP